MLDIAKVESPIFFETYMRQYSPRSWDEFDGQVRSKLKEHILEHEQTQNSSYYCAYCEAKIRKESSHIEHIKPRCDFTSETFNYDNLLISCEHIDTCGKYKKNNYFTAFIDPVNYLPSDYFSYAEDGMINATDEDAIKTIEILNLNSKRLKDARKTFYLQLGTYGSELDEFSEYLDDFPTLLKYYLENECR